MNLDHSSDGSLKIVPLWLRGIEDLNWMCTTRYTLECVWGGREGGREGRKEMEGDEEEEERNTMIWCTITTLHVGRLVV